MAAAVSTTMPSTFTLQARLLSATQRMPTIRPVGDAVAEPCTNFGVSTSTGSETLPICSRSPPVTLWMTASSKVVVSSRYGTWMPVVPSFKL